MTDQGAPAGVDVERPSSARIYDYWLGGTQHFASDRAVAEEAIARFPHVVVGARRNRAFLRRAVRYMMDAGVRQFLDIGSGIPTVGHVHEIAQRLDPDARVVYVDVDPVAVAHSEQILAGNPNAVVIQEDIRATDYILTHPKVGELLDLSQPVAVLTVALLHFLVDGEEPREVLARLMAPLAAGSYLALSHGTTDGDMDLEAGADLYERAGIHVTFRDHAGVRALFGDLEPVDPGVVWVTQWHPDLPDEMAEPDDGPADPASTSIYAGVARKP